MHEITVADQHQLEGCALKTCEMIPNHTQNEGAYIE